MDMYRGPRARTIGEVVVMFRRRSGTSRDDLARVVDISTGQLTRIERDMTERIDAVKLQALVRELADRCAEDFDALWSDIAGMLETMRGGALDNGDDAG